MLVVTMCSHVLVFYSALVYLTVFNVYVGSQSAYTFLS
jgi:hypothetical protein